MVKAPFLTTLWHLLRTFSWQELRHHPWRNAAAVVAVMLGVALAFSVHLINASALDEFSNAVRATTGQPDLEVRSSSAAGLDETLLARVLRHPQVAMASPVLEFSTYAHTAAPPDNGSATPAKRVLLRIVGIDALQVIYTAPELLPVPDKATGRLDLFAPDALFLNAAARAALGTETVLLQQGLQSRPLRVAGSVRASGAPLAVMDIAAMQEFFSRQGYLSRIDLRLQSGTDKSAFVAGLQAQADWPASARITEPGDAVQRIGNLSRAYRVNLTVLALIALFTGGFLVFSVLSLSVARRAKQFALLGVLGLTGRARMALVLLEAAALGLVGSALGLLLGTGLAALGLRLLGGDLGGGYFSGTAPALQWSGQAAAVFAALGMACALAGAWWPARAAQAMPPAQTLKGLGSQTGSGAHAGAGAALLVAGGLLALLPPVGGISLAAYLSVALLLLGGIAVLPFAVGKTLDRAAPLLGRHVLALLAVERARRVRESAAVAVSGVVAALSLAVALTVMVSSFRNSVTQWLDTVLPASLYVRASGSASANEAVFMDPEFVAQAARLPGVLRVSTQRSISLQLNPDKPAVALLVKPLHDPLTQTLALPLVGDVSPVPPGRIAIYVSEAILDLYGVRPGGDFAALSAALSAGTTPLFVAGVWRDYARQFGTVAMDAQDFARLSADKRVNDMALWLTPDADVGTVQQDLRALAARTLGKGKADDIAGAGAELLEFGSAQEIRATTLKIFDRSFAVTYWLQAVAIGIGLFGVAASFSAQVLARRKEFGLLQHLGLTRAQVLRLVGAEGAAWTVMGALAGICLGLAVAVVLVHVVNPQSFHWTMDLNVPRLRLLALGLAVVAAGTLTARLSAGAAASQDAVMAVKEDW